VAARLIPLLDGTRTRSELMAALLDPHRDSGDHGRGYSGRGRDAARQVQGLIALFHRYGLLDPEVPGP
jgi:hypothetical protein